MEGIIVNAYTGVRNATFEKKRMLKMKIVSLFGLMQNARAENKTLLFFLMLENSSFTVASGKVNFQCRVSIQIKVSCEI